MHRFLPAVMLLAVLASAHESPAQLTNWAAGDARVTRAELLQLYFNLDLHRHEQDSFNSFNLIDFYPSTSASQAILFIVQTYNDRGASTDDPKVREEIRKAADGLVVDFASQFHVPLVSKRWSPDDPKKVIVIRHVRVHDLQDTLAVTISGVTSFEREDFKRAEQRVRQAGGLWAW